VNGEKTMKVQIDFDGHAEALKRSLGRAAISRRPHEEPRAAMRRTRALLRTGEHGSALVEFALLLPALLALLTGILSVGVAFNNDVMLTNAVNQGALSVQASAGYLTDPCGTAAQAIVASAPNLVSAGSKGMRLSMSINNGASIYGPSPATSFSCDAGAVALTQGTSVTVSATYPCKLGIYGMSLSGGCQLSAQTTELVQ
jgi:Flp pilus assembly protein TadG